VACMLQHDLLDAYLDHELGVERTLEVESHLASCRRCASEVETWKEIREPLHASALYHRAPAQLEEKIRKMVRPSTVAEKLPWFQRWLWAGGGAAFAAAALLIAFAITRPPTASPNEALVDNHVRSLMPGHLMDVVSTDQHTVKPWFDGKVEFAPPVQDFASAGYPLVGGRLDYVENHKAAVLIYRRALHVINVYIWPTGNTASSAPTVQTIRGYNIVSWQKTGFEFRAVSDLNTTELREFAHLVSP
jgi:anti-sigma factor RsiW